MADLIDVIHKMNAQSGFDVVIVCTSDQSQEDYWQPRLQATRGYAAKKDAIVLAVHEDWEGGAGNGLGTLYAYTKAKAKASKEGHDLDALLASGASVAIFHTAGKGTRLAPLPGSETNNKPGVKLSSLVSVEGQLRELSILEAVIRQTGLYADVRKGRCSVFWGDQIFVPSSGALPSGKHHADILATLGPMPTAQEWKERSMEKYGLIAVRPTGEAVQVEKVTFEQATKLFGGADSVEKVGPSVGSFSISSEMLQLLLKEFEAELTAKKGKLDSDPHFWMPMTLSQEHYIEVMLTKGTTAEDAAAHYARMTRFKHQLTSDHPEKGVFGCIDVGQSCYWWDYGQLAFFFKYSLLAVQENEEAAALRTFLNVTNRQQESKVGMTSVCGSSVVLNSRIGSGNVKASVLASVSCNEIDVEDCVLVNVTATKIKAKGCVLYNVIDNSADGLVFADGSVRADVARPGSEPLVVRSKLSIDGGKAWYDKVEGNSHSFDEIHVLNRSISVIAAQADIQQRRQQAQASLSLPQ